MDEFVDIPGYPGYRANRLGQIIGKRGLIIKPQIHKGGYLRVDICIDGNRKGMYVHRLVAFTFIPNTQGLETVDHIDNNQSNNSVENLRWLTNTNNTNRRDYVINAKCYYNRLIGFNVEYTIEGNRHTKYFRCEDDAQFYVSILKAIYPRE